MNWKEIRIKYKEAYAKWFNFTQTDLAEKVLQSNNQVYYSGLLYSFFDENGIIVSVQGFINDHNIKVFDYCIQEYNTINGMAGDWFNDRVKCEEKAFTKAFEILENKLK